MGSLVEQIQRIDRSPSIRPRTAIFSTSTVFNKRIDVRWYFMRWHNVINSHLGILFIVGSNGYFCTNNLVLIRFPVEVISKKRVHSINDPIELCSLSYRLIVIIQQKNQPHSFRYTNVNQKQFLSIMCRIPSLFHLLCM